MILLKNSLTKSIEAFKDLDGIQVILNVVVTEMQLIQQNTFVSYRSGIAGTITRNGRMIFINQLIALIITALNHWEQQTGINASEVQMLTRSNFY